MADRFDLRRDIRFRTRVTSATWDAPGTRWIIETDRGDRAFARFCIMALGCLSAPNRPPFEGLEDFELEYAPKLSREAFLERLPRYHGLIVRSGTQVDAEAFERAKRLRAVVRAGVGVDNIDLEAATRAGVLVMNTPQGNTVAAAEHAVALLMALARRIPQAHAALKAGRWERKRWIGVGLAGKTLGVIGLGKVGREVARRGVGLQMRVLGYDPFVTEELARSLEIEVAPLEEVVRESDFLSVHVPLTEQTRGLIDERRLGLMKPGAYVINTARGGVIDEAALCAALERGALGGAALDVFTEEPLPATSPLLAHEAIVMGRSSTRSTWCRSNRRCSSAWRHGRSCSRAWAACRRSFGTGRCARWCCATRGSCSGAESASC